MRFLSKVTATLAMSLSILAPAKPATTPGFSTVLQGERSSLAIRSAFVVPGEEVRVSASEPFRLSGGTAFETEMLWRAPQKPGWQAITLSSQGGQAVVINVFVLTPYSQIRAGKLAGYSIGSYPDGKAPYRQPGGFVEVNAETQSVWVTPHFQLKQFLCKQAGGNRKYLLLSERLLIKLEHIVARLQAQSIKAETLFIMSGYRTPSYNRALGNVSRSRHLYGDAADIFVDSNPRDGRMDDLNGDGRSDLKDSEFLHDIVQSLESEQGGNFPVGGLGLYTSNHSHGPFVHVDARGHLAKWGGAGVTVSLKGKKSPVRKIAPRI